MSDEPQPADGAADQRAGEGEDGPAGERDQMEAYAEFRQALEALPGAPAFQALVVQYGQQFGYRAVGRWIAGRVPKARKGASREDGAADG